MLKPEIQLIAHIVAVVVLVRAFVRPGLRVLNLAVVAGRKLELVLVHALGEVGVLVLVFARLVV